MSKEVRDPVIKPSCSCVPSEPCVSAAHIWILFRHLSRNVPAVIFTPIHTRGTIWCSGCLLWHQFGLSNVYLHLCVSANTALWLDGLYDGDILLRTNFKRWQHSSWQWQRFHHACLWIFLLFLPLPLPSPSYLHPSFHLPSSELWINSTAQLWYPCQYFEDGGRTMQWELSFYFNLSGAWRKCFRFNIIILLFSSLCFLKWR